MQTAPALNGGAGRVLDAHECGRVLHGSAAAGDDPVVEPSEQVGAGDLGLGAKDAAAFQSGSFSPRNAWNTVPDV